MSEDERYGMSQFKNGQTGPKTIAGKAISSKNSTKHGLTARSLTNPIDKASAEAFYQELNTYYKLSSPLEKLMAQRMSQHKVQLENVQRAREIEVQMRVNDLMTLPETILQEMPTITGTTKGMLLELIKYQQIELPCELTPELLKNICSEISRTYAAIESEEVFVKVWPTLSTYLMSLDVSQFAHDIGIQERLKVVVDRIQQVLKDGEHYQEHLKMIFKDLDLFQKSALHLEDGEDLDELVNKLKSFGSCREESNSHESTGSKRLFIKNKELIKITAVFKELYWHFIMAKSALISYENKKALMIEAARLPSDREEILLRYQVTGEKRLSADLGEFLTLINHHRN